METIVLATGGFDPLHSGHIAYFKAAKLLGDILIVGLNSDEWLEHKKGKAFLPWNERLCIINNLSMVDEVYTFDDEDGTAKHFIQQVRAHYPNNKLIFANGGDRTKDNIPEMDTDVTNIEFVFGVGGDEKKNSSSWLLEEWKFPKTVRPWGYYSTLYHPRPDTKVKELVVRPGACLSMQRHKERNEFWFVAKGKASLYTLENEQAVIVDKYVKFDYTHISRHKWHRLCNEGSEDLHIIEIQYGEKCEEHDIESYYF